MLHRVQRSPGSPGNHQHHSNRKAIQTVSRSRSPRALNPACEEADNYSRVVLRWDFSEAKATRIIECRNQIQWIIQYKSGTRGGQPSWRPQSYLRTRQALERLLPGMAEEIAAALPVRFVEAEARSDLS
ncbi:hypothetical protein X749_25290 [Mesorhizobium sp. LNJC391B00]|nr:hypothetical protein X749_25290 [Mesorhizobium sp. LNJC391B00]